MHFQRRGLYYGLSASLGRQAVFSTLRHGTYNAVRQKNPNMGFVQQVGAALAIGGTAAFCANPCDVIMVRMQADGHWNEAQKRGYKTLFDGLRRTVAEEGVCVLWRGCGPTVTRAMLVTAAQFGSYHPAKEALMQRGFGDSTFTHFLASAFSGLVATVITSPVDVVKTRVMNMQRGVGVGQYSSVLDCVLQTIRAEGLTGLYKGFGPTFVRQVPHTIALWMFQEKWLSVLRQSFPPVKESLSMYQATTSVKQTCHVLSDHSISLKHVTK